MKKKARADESLLSKKKFKFKKFKNKYWNLIKDIKL